MEPRLQSRKANIYWLDEIVIAACATYLNHWLSFTITSYR
jgi:hypothetical protein